MLVLLMMLVMVVMSSQEVQSLPGVPGPRVMRAFMLKKEMMDMLVTLVMLMMMVMERRITNNDLYSKVHTGPKTMMVMWVRMKIRMTIRMKKQMRMNVDLFHQDRECTLSLLCSLHQGIVEGSDSSPKLSPEMIKKIKVRKTKKRVQRDKKMQIRAL